MHMDRVLCTFMGLVKPKDWNTECQMKNLKKQRKKKRLYKCMFTHTSSRKVESLRGANQCNEKLYTSVGKPEAAHF